MNILNVILKFLIFHSVQVFVAILLCFCGLSDGKSLNSKEDVMATNETTCKEFGEMFDDFECKNSSSSETDLLDQYCVRKFVIDNDLIDLSIYNVTINPTNLNVTGVECGSMIETGFELGLTRALDSKHHELTPEQKECIGDKLRNKKFYNQMLRTMVIKELQLTDEQAAIERPKFIQFMLDLTQEIPASCWPHQNKN